MGKCLFCGKEATTNGLCRLHYISEKAKELCARSEEDLDLEDDFDFEFLADDF